MRVTIFGATGPTGSWLCKEALSGGHDVTAVTRRTGPSPLDSEPALSVVHADAASGAGVDAAVADADAVLSTLGCAYSRHPIDVYSAGTRNIVEGMRKHASGRRLIVVSSGLTYPPPHYGWFADHLIFPLLRNVIGRTLYTDMRAMEEYLATCDDIDWTVMRPGRLIDAAAVSDYQLDLGHPTQPYTARPDLAAAMVTELSSTSHIHQAVAPTTERRKARA